uniref:mitogen-activated protein kinase kinase n=1 Tax=Ditylenchus dipsaci TaxID=166011 RepID=A0A915CT39_9BILA
MAPERIQGDLYKIHSDVWSLGLSLLEMALGHFPESPSQSILKLSCSTTILTTNQSNQEEAASSEKVSENTYPKAIGHGFESLISSCLQHNPLDRPRPHQIIQSEFIQAHNPPNTHSLALFVQNFGRQKNID